MWGQRVRGISGSWISGQTWLPEVLVGSIFREERAFSPTPIKNSAAEDRFETAKRRQILGGAAHHETRAVVKFPERYRQRAQGQSVEPVEKWQRKPGKVRAVRHEEQAGTAGPDDGPDAGAGLFVEFFENAPQRALDGVELGHDGRVEVDPGESGKIAKGDAAG